MSLTTQFYTMLAMIGMGSWLGAALDTYGRFLKRPTRAHWLVFINDVLFWMFQGLITFYILLLVNEGELRFYIFFALLCGFAFYQSLLKSAYNQLLEGLIRQAIRMYKFLKYTFQLFVIKPIILLYRCLLVIFMGLFQIAVIIGNILLNVTKIVLKILLFPLKWIGNIILNLLPNRFVENMEKFLTKQAGIFKKIENIKHIVKKLWKSFRKS